MQPVLALKVNDRDNVATVFSEELRKGGAVEIRDKKGGTCSLVAADDIPYGHKIALAGIDKGTPVIKYGEELGHASADIKKGEHVHVHNLESMRGRGDLGRK